MSIDFEARDRAREEPRLQHELPFFSICSLGPQRWFWVVWASTNSLLDGFRNRDNTAAKEHGYATTELEALAAVRHIAGPDARWGQNKFAAMFHRALCCERRAQKRSATTEGKPLEFVYCEEWGAAPVPHRIVKKTARRVYIEVDPYDPARDKRLADLYPEGWALYDRRTAILDRITLERDGKAVVGEWGDTFYLRPEDAARTSAAPTDCIHVLGLTWPATAKDVRQAFRRLSKAAHPDRGGDHEAFIRLQHAYEQALRMVHARGTQADPAD